MSESSQTTLHVFPLDSDEPIVGKAIAAFEKPLATDVLAILKEQGVTWDTCSLDRYGKDMKTLDNSPPTILVSTPDINQHAWGTVRTKAKAAISAAGVSVPFEFIPSTLSLLFYGKDQENWGARLPITRSLEIGASISMPV
ncbi:hypothetical protein OEA41_007712 [Lepraria neglecta]|uniref:Uncharacterized protein n=1 Tax=Lepraria neglecta TaxID=209136 RepID=A0AAD9ZG06_9LECA|nr:hypothetical protein OEA41_007712 [Lepraria neglecta]